nr:anoctamin-3-like [Onthophagus taurus]XP_022921290.1 anoctamin-3-like [Onthophagus taurus]
MVENLTFSPEVKSPADFILVQSRIVSETAEIQNTKFINNLKKAGLTVEPVDGVKYPQYIFFKLYASDEALAHLAVIHGLFPTFKHDKTMPNYTNNCRFFKTPISLKPNYLNPLFSRCSNSVRGQENTTFTSAERISLINCVLTRTKFGTSPDEYGLGKLLANNNFDDAFPLHDGPDEWSESGPLNDRQILAKFWGNWRMFYKFQPIHIIYKYYGSEIAFHYAWLEFYTKCLIIPAVLGIFVFFGGHYDLYLSENGVERVDEICNSNMKMCPTCTHQHCYYKELKDYCETAVMAYHFDNIYTFSFGVFIIVWATVYIELWDREECILHYTWNLHRSTQQIDEL